MTGWGDAIDGLYGDNGTVGRARALGGRVVRASGSIAVAQEWPLVAGGVLASFSLAEVIVRAEDFGRTPFLALLLGLCSTVPIVLARTDVLAAGGIVTGAMVLSLVAPGRPTAAGLVAQVVALYLVGRRFSWRASGVMVAPLLVFVVAAPSGGGLGDRLFPLAMASLALAAIGLGNARRIRGEVVAQDAARQAFAETVLENAARGERARIARELHDVVAHHISMIAVQAETARLTTSRMPPEGAERLGEIGDTARAALTEMRRLLGVLREDAETETTRKPQPGLQELIHLIDEARGSAGASTRLIVRGCVAPLDPGIELTAFRIVQEALTNARRHAPGAAVDVELRYADGGLRLCVRDNGPGPRDRDDGDANDGHGLLGMRERVAMVGGRLSAGPAPASGFLVEAYLPASRPEAVVGAE